jgi:hypothetical protein
MALPARVYLTLHETSARWGYNIADIAGWADAGRFRILTGITAVRCGDEVITGKVTLSPMELMPLFRRCGTGPSEGIMRRSQPAGRHDWLLITDPVCGITVAVADMVIMAEDVHTFEDENDTRFARTGVGLNTFGGVLDLGCFALNARRAGTGLTVFFQTRGRPAATLVSNRSTSVGVMSVTLRDRHSGTTSVLSMLA